MHNNISQDENEIRIRTIWALFGMLAFTGAVMWFIHKYGDKVLK
jgi:hypothetical protein